MDYVVIGTFLGFLAGSTLIYSGWPALSQQLLTPGMATDGERRSRFIMVVGNILWVLSGLLTMNFAVIGMCGLNAIIQAVIWFKMKK